MYIKVLFNNTRDLVDEEYYSYDDSMDYSRDLSDEESDTRELTPPQRGGNVFVAHVNEELLNFQKESKKISVDNLIIRKEFRETWLWANKFSRQSLQQFLDIPRIPT